MGDFGSHNILPQFLHFVKWKNTIGCFQNGYKIFSIISGVPAKV